MSLLHVEPIPLYLASRSLWQANYMAIDQLFRLRVALLRLEGAWLGPAADDFLAETRSLQQQLTERVEELISLSLALAREADRWEESDQRWAGVYRTILSTPPGE